MEKVQSETSFESNIVCSGCGTHSEVEVEIEIEVGAVVEAVVVGCCDELGVGG